MSLYVIKLTGRIVGQPDNPLLSVFTYNSSTLLPSSAEALSVAQLFDDTFFSDSDQLQAMLSPLFEFQSIEVTSPYNETVLAVVSISHEGAALGVEMPRFVALEWASPRTRADIRQGFKRFGVTTEAVVEGDALASGFVATAANVSAVLSTTLLYDVDGLPQAAVPVIVKRIPIIVSGETIGYRYPTSDLELQYSVADNWLFRRVTSQNSRKT